MIIALEMISNDMQQNVSKNHEQVEMLRSLQRSPHEFWHQLKVGW
ncbi:hypothetical protein PVAP13_1KG482500 [Panicum virgatum]|uniref:Uncharacterized protein n=1 Tax=Panicum virgatum TaxID=38727 RepID=A0A8T0XS91_PANVG|nr:hypothetical protein PVAP13_1KG482500 [Panicum virgatum]